MKERHKYSTSEVHLIRNVFKLPFLISLLISCNNNVKSTLPDFGKNDYWRTGQVIIFRIDFWFQMSFVPKAGEAEGSDRGSCRVHTSRGQAHTRGSEWHVGTEWFHSWLWTLCQTLLCTVWQLWGSRTRSHPRGAAGCWRGSGEEDPGGQRAAKRLGTSCTASARRAPFSLPVCDESAISGKWHFGVCHQKSVPELIF